MGHKLNRLAMVAIAVTLPISGLHAAKKRKTMRTVKKIEKVEKKPASNWSTSLYSEQSKSSASGDNLDNFTFVKVNYKIDKNHAVPLLSRLRLIGMTPLRSLKKIYG